MIKRLAFVAVLVLAFGVACGGEDEEGEEGDAANQACIEPPVAMSGTPTLPTGFPTPDNVTYTGQHKAGPSQIVDGYYDGDITEAFDSYKGALEDADGYDVTKDEKEEDDAEVNFEGGGSSGQVKLLQSCEDRTSITITARPE